MNSQNAGLDTLLKSHMKYMTARQQVLAQNIANIDTPGYKAKDVKRPDFAKMASSSLGKLEMRATNANHMSGTLGKSGGRFPATEARDTFETSPTQNNVVLEDQMAKISDTGAQYQISSSLMRKMTQLYRKAAGSNQ